MKQSLPEYIKHNEDLRNVLLAQDGGIMKYLAERLDANGTAALFNDYQDQCVEEFFEKNKWDLRVVWAGDEMRRAALGYEHLWRELHLQTKLKKAVVDMPAETIEIVNDFTEQYLTWAYMQNRLRWFPNGIMPLDVYQEAIGVFSSAGLAYKCMQLILREHHANGKMEITKSDFYEEFQIRQYLNQLKSWHFLQMRQAVAEMLAGKDADQCRQMAIDTMERVRGFSQMIYTDVVVQSLRDIEYMKEADQRESDGEWLRDAAYRAMREDFSDNIKTHSMHYYYALFVNLLQDLGQIWAAQLLVHDIDMKDLEDQVACIMNPVNTPRYYVDKHYSDDQQGQYCISNSEMAERLLKKIGRKLSQQCYLKLANEDIKENEAISTLSRAYNILTKEGFVDSKRTKLRLFVDVLLNNKNAKIYWQNDPTRKFLKEVINVFLGKSKRYLYPAILAPSECGKQWAFVKQHFVDEKGNGIEIKSNTTKLGKKDVEQFERILKAIYDQIKIYPKPKKT